MQKEKSFIVINNCKHYFLNEEGKPILFFYHSAFFVERDYDTKHPIGEVYKPKGCSDTVIRFVRQPNNSVFMFSEKDWNVKGNPFYIGKNENKMGKVRVGNKQNAVLNGEWAGHVRRWWKKFTSGKRRAVSKRFIKGQIHCSEGLGCETYKD
jgi:hypothetical protein